MSHKVSQFSQFDRDMDKLSEMVDYLECLQMYPENNPINKKDIFRMCHRIRNMADRIALMTLKAGYVYFEEVVDNEIQ